MPIKSLRDLLIVQEQRYVRRKIYLFTGREALFFNFSRGDAGTREAKSISRVFCQLRCGPDPMVSVDHGGKLSERRNGNESVDFEKRHSQNSSRHTASQSEFLTPIQKPKGAGITAAQGWVSAYFSCPPRKAKMTWGCRRKTWRTRE